MQQSPYKRQSLIASFKFAIHGLKILFTEERNFKIHTALVIIVIIACIFFKVTKVEWICVSLLMAMVLMAEGINTCIEYLCDLVSLECHPMIKRIKDIAAGLVMIIAIVAIVIGCVIFVPYIKTLFV